MSKAAIHKYTINDRPASRGEWFSSKEDGVHKAYSESGALLYEYPYVNGQRHGVLKEYYESGALRYEFPYVNGQRHGVYKRYYQSGVLEYKEFWVNGELREDLKDNRLAQVVLFGVKE